MIYPYRDGPLPLKVNRKIPNQQDDRLVPCTKHSNNPLLWSNKTTVHLKSWDESQESSIKHQPHNHLTSHIHQPSTRPPSDCDRSRDPSILVPLKSWRTKVVQKDVETKPSLLSTWLRPYSTSRYIQYQYHTIYSFVCLDVYQIEELSCRWPSLSLKINLQCEKRYQIINKTMAGPPNQQAVYPTI